MRKNIPLSCSECKNEFYVEKRYYNTMMKEGRKTFWCCDSCRLQFKRREKVEEVNCPKCNSKFVRNKTLKRLKKFCSIKCANSHTWSMESREKASIATKKVAKQKRGSFTYEKDKLISDKCILCNTDFLKKKHSPKRYCSLKCRRTVYKKGNCGGYRPHSGRAKTGFYKGIYCGSTYELAFLIWHQDNNININRCDKVFIYNKTRKYYPDFEINGIIYEIKGYYTPEVSLKEAAVREKGFKYEILYRQDVQSMIDYVKKEYKVNYLELLYETPPKYRFTYQCAKCGKEIKCNTKRKSEFKFCSRKCLDTQIIRKNKPAFNV